MSVLPKICGIMQRVLMAGSWSSVFRTAKIKPDPHQWEVLVKWRWLDEAENSWACVYTLGRYTAIIGAVDTYKGHNGSDCAKKGLWMITYGLWLLPWRCQASYLPHVFSQKWSIDFISLLFAAIETRGGYRRNHFIFKYGVFLIFLCL